MRTPPQQRERLRHVAEEQIQESRRHEQDEDRLAHYVGGDGYARARASGGQLVGPLGL
jgi:hypothetical protein